MKLRFISVFLLGSLLAGTPVSAQQKEQKSVLKKGPNVSLNITNKKVSPKDLSESGIVQQLSVSEWIGHQCHFKLAAL